VASLIGNQGKVSRHIRVVHVHFRHLVQQMRFSHLRRYLVQEFILVERILLDGSHPRVIGTPEYPLVHLVLQIVDAFVYCDVITDLRMEDEVVADLVLDHQGEIVEELEGKPVERAEVAVLEDFVKEGDITCEPNDIRISLNHPLGLLSLHLSLGVGSL
jgi:hypothetical protein